MTKRALKIRFKEYLLEESKGYYRKALILFFLSVLINLLVLATLIIGPEKIRNWLGITDASKTEQPLPQNAILPTGISPDTLQTSSDRK